MGQRLELHSALQTVLGSENVYFQPPPDHMISYPCIVYNRSNIRTAFGDNSPYKMDKQYQITVIDPNPDSLIPDKVASLPRCSFDRHFTSDGLNHDVFNILF